jgi:hypothetical protein
MTISALYATLDFLGGIVASLPLRVFRSLPGGGKERAVEHQGRRRRCLPLPTWRPCVVEKAKSDLRAAQGEAKAQADRARAVVRKAKDAYRAALAPYRQACLKAGVECEYEGGRSLNVSEKLAFLVEKTGAGVRVMVKGRPKTEEVIPLPALKESINGTASAYTEKHVGSIEEIGSKGESLSNRLLAVLG